MFSIIGEDAGSKARVGKLQTRHGPVETPCFMPVATKASIKTLGSEEAIEAGVEAIIANAFLLYLKPGIEVIKGAGGLHAFMNWNGIIFTDSGGFQVLRRDFLLGTSKRGLHLRSPFDNSKHLITPEKCIEMQAALGSDVAMVLDDIAPYGSDRARSAEAVKRTIDWARRCKEARKDEGQGLFAIAQGGIFWDLREECERALVEMDFDGYGLGGLSIGEPEAEMYALLERTKLPEDKPRYLMGVGSPPQLLEAISRGIDIFDSAFPTRNARHNTVYTHRGKYDLSRAKYAKDFGPLEGGCGCRACGHYTRAYINHLLKVREILGMKLVTLHNLSFIQRLLEKTRRSIAEGEFNSFKEEFVSAYGSL